MTAALLDENHSVIQEFKPDAVTLDPDCDDCSWRQVYRELRCATLVQWLSVFVKAWMSPSRLWQLSGTSSTSVWSRMLTQYGYARSAQEQKYMMGK